MKDTVLIVSSTEIIIEEIVTKLNQLGIYNIEICKSREEANDKLTVSNAKLHNIKFIILDQDLKELKNSDYIKEYNGEEVAIKLMQDDIEIPTSIVGTKTIIYDDDNTVSKINIATENLADAIEDIIIKQKIMDGARDDKQ